MHVLGSAVAASGGDVYGVVVYVAHGDVAHHDVFHPPLVHLLEGQAAAVHEGAVCQRDVAVAAVALRAQLEASAHPSHRLRGVGAVEQRAALVAGDVAVADGYVFAQHGLFQRVARLQHQCVVAGGVYAAVAHGHVLAAVYVEAVAVGVDGHIVNGGEVAAGHDDGEVAAAVYGHVADGHTAAELQGDGLVSLAY